MSSIYKLCFGYKYSVLSEHSTMNDILTGNTPKDSSHNLLGFRVNHWDFDGSQSDFHIVNPTVRLAGGHISTASRSAPRSARFKPVNYSDIATCPRNTQQQWSHQPPHPDISCSPTSTSSAASTSISSARALQTRTAPPTGTASSTQQVQLVKRQGFQKQHKPNGYVSPGPLVRAEARERKGPILLHDPFLRENLYIPTKWIDCANHPADRN